jgi:hypothetical protein
MTNSLVLIISVFLLSRRATDTMSECDAEIQGIR